MLTVSIRLSTRATLLTHVLSAVSYRARVTCLALDSPAHVSPLHHDTLDNGMCKFIFFSTI